MPVLSCAPAADTGGRDRRLGLDGGGDQGWEKTCLVGDDFAQNHSKLRSTKTLSETKAAEGAFGTTAMAGPTPGLTCVADVGDNPQRK